MNTVVLFVSRPHGYNVLTSLVENTDYKILMVFTHSLNPKSQDPLRSEREDYYLFKKICLDNKIPLSIVDSKNDKIENVPKCDFIVEVSWRYLIPIHITKKAKFGAFGIHRGKLPQYSGSEPVKQALKAGEKKIFLSAHYLAEIIDAGTVITELSHPVNYRKESTFEDNIQRLREEITPLFSKIMFQSFKILKNRVKF